MANRLKERRSACRPGCGACCIAPSISSAIPGMPAGKPAGVRCVQLTPDSRCRLFGRPERPKVCIGLQPGREMCGCNFIEAMANLDELEIATRPESRDVSDDAVISEKVIFEEEMSMSDVDRLVEMYQEKIDQEIDVGSWFEIGQDRIGRFAEVTGDEQWIHTDPKRAAEESPFRTTIAHGFLTLSLLPKLTASNTPEYFQKNYPGMSRRINYGLNKVRFPAPVPAGCRIRAHTQVSGVRRVGEGVEIAYTYTIEIQGSDKPGCVAEQIFRLYP